MKFTGERFLFGGSSNRTKIDALVKYIFASFFVRDKKVLDIACGSGFGSFMLAQEASEVLGLDLSPEAINHSNENYKKENLKFIIGDAENNELPKDYFDIIVSFETIEHLKNPEKFVEQLRQSVKKEGMIILATPNKKIVSPFNKEPIGKFHTFEFYKKDLEKMFKDKFATKWYGQRCTFKPLANFFIRRFIRLIEVLFNQKFGFYGGRESYQILPLTFWRESKDFVVLLKKYE